jgi:hypothetical protein
MTPPAGAACLAAIGWRIIRMKIRWEMFENEIKVKNIPP